MKVTVGGSYHQPGWTYVCKLIEKLKKHGYEVLAPNPEDWTPIEANANFVKFKGEEHKDAFDLQKGFLNKIQQSDIFIICNVDSYEGMCVSAEMGFAASTILNNIGNLKQIYIVESPLGYDFVGKNKKFPSEQEYKELLLKPEYDKQLNTVKRLSKYYKDFSEFYEDMLGFLGKILFFEESKILTVGINKLFDLKQEQDEERY